METTPIDQDEKAPTMINHALKWGIIGGAISIVFIVLLYVVDYTMMVQFKFLIISLLISLALVSYAGIEYRKSVGGYLSFGKAWQVSWLTMAISSFIYILFTLLLYNVIDSELPDKLVEASLDNARAMMENFGAPPDSIDAEVEKARARTENQFKPGGMAISFGVSLIISAILSLITGLIAKKNPPIDQM